MRSIALVSVTNARLVAQNLDETLKKGVLKCLLRSLPIEKESVGISETSAARRKDARIEAMNLATALLKTADSAVITYICKSGSHELKVKAGILFIAFRKGLQEDRTLAQQFEDEYIEAVVEMLVNFCSLILNQSRAINRKLLHDLLVKEPLQNLSRLLSSAPPLPNGITFLDVLFAEDSYE